MWSRVVFNLGQRMPQAIKHLICVQSLGGVGCRAMPSLLVPRLKLPVLVLLLLLLMRPVLLLPLALCMPRVGRTALLRRSNHVRLVLQIGSDFLTRCCSHPFCFLFLRVSGRDQSFHLFPTVRSLFLLVRDLLP